MPSACDVRPGVLINGRFLARPVTGVERFAWEMVRALDALRAGGGAGAVRRMTILCPPEVAVLPDFDTVPCKRVGPGSGYLWEQVTLPAAARGNLVVNLCSMAPLAARKVVAIHDANVWLTPASYSRAFVLAYRVLLPLVARTSRCCVTVSDYSKAQLHRHGVVGRTPLAVIRNGVDHVHRMGSDKAPPELPETFVLALGSVSPNKNLGLLTSLAPRLRQHGIALVVAGGRNASVFNGTSLAGDGVVFLGRVDDAELHHAYGKALCFAFPSFYEGFGIPPLEAMARGCPVVASDTSAMPEVLGDAAILCDPAAPEQWLAAILGLHRDGRLRALLSRRGRQRAARFTWERAARQLLDIIEEQA